MICCTSCGEILTAPVFINGKPYGYTCAVKVSPSTKKPKKKDNWIKAESYTQVTNGADCIAIYKGKKYKSRFFETRMGFDDQIILYSDGMAYDGTNVYINLVRFKR